MSKNISPFDWVLHFTTTTNRMVEGELSTLPSRQVRSSVQGTSKARVREKPYKTPFFNMVPDILLEEEFFQVHPVVKQLFFKKIPRVNLAGRLKFFLQGWKTHTGSNNTRSCTGLQNPISYNSRTTLSTSPAKNEGTRQPSYPGRNRSHVEERGYSRSFPCKQGISQQSVSSFQKGEGKQTSNKPKTFEQFCSISTFQNGRSPSC